MRIKTLLPALAATLLAATPIAAQETLNYLPNTGQELVDLIETCEDDACMSYVSGVIGGISIYALLAEKPSPFCAGGSVETDKIRDVIVEAISATPKLQENHPAVGILAAFGRTWPCMTTSDMQDLQKSSARILDAAVADRILTSGRHILAFGSEDAPANRTLAVFHDPGVTASNRLRAETRKLINDGWRVVIFPVALDSESSAGFGAVQMALRDIAPDAIPTLYEADPVTADFATAIDLAKEAGVDTNVLLTAIATSGAYTAVESNTRVLSEIGAKSAPAWIVGNALYTGYLSAPAIRNIAAGGNIVADTPSPEEMSRPSEQMEQ